MRSDGERESEINETIRYYCRDSRSAWGFLLIWRIPAEWGLPDIGVVMPRCPHYR